MQDQPPQLPAVRQSAFDVSWPRALSGIPGKCKVNEFGEESEKPHTSRGVDENVHTVNPAILKIFSLHEDIGEIAMQLLRESWNNFKQLTLRNWADDVLCAPTKVEHLRLYYNRLAFSCFTFLHHVPEITKYNSLATTIQSHDRFLHASLLHGLAYAQNGKPYAALTLDTSPITVPLHDFLSSPEAGSGCRFAVLEARYLRYRRGPDLARGHSFQTATPLLDLLLGKPTADVSGILTREIIPLFRQISLEGIWSDDCHLRAIAQRWSFLCYAVEEIAASGRMNSSLLELAQHLCYQRDFFSLTAILRGMSGGGIEVEPDFAGFLDEARNYQTYRLHLHQEPCLPFVYTFIKEMKRGNLKAARGIFSFIGYEQIYTYSK